MKRVYFRSMAGVYGAGFEAAKSWPQLPTWLWAVEYPGDGVLQEHITECFENSTEWTGWTFFHIPLTLKDYHARESVPAFLFQDRKDAFWAHFKWGDGNRLNNLPKEAFER